MIEAGPDVVNFPIATVLFQPGQFAGSQAGSRVNPVSPRPDGDAGMHILAG